MDSIDISVEIQPKYDREHGQMVICGKAAGQIFEIARVNVVNENDMEILWRKISDKMNQPNRAITDAV